MKSYKHVNIGSLKLSLKNFLIDLNTDTLIFWHFISRAPKQLVIRKGQPTLTHTFLTKTHNNVVLNNAEYFLSSIPNMYLRHKEKSFLSVFVIIKDEMFA